MNPRLKLVVADDHPIFRKGLLEVIAESDEFEVVAAVAHGEEALRVCLERQPDVAILDFEMPRLNGAEVAARLREAGSATAVAVLTAHKDPTIFNRALDAGVAGFVLKDNAAEEIVACIRSVARGEPYVSPSASRLLLQRRDAAARLQERHRGLQDLTPQERRVLRLVSENLTSKEIATRLGTSPRTVENHRFRICEKIGLSGSHSLLKFAFDNKSALAAEPDAP
jgi:DNA-binding NarL/FixJ family response regulator